MQQFVVEPQLPSTEPEGYAAAIVVCVKDPTNMMVEAKPESAKPNL